MTNKREIGDFYEEKAVKFLEEQGFEILERNFRCKIGEIDIVAKEQEYLVFVEVKYRKNVRLGLPQEAVDWRKQQKIRKVSDYYRMVNRIGENIPIRYDVVWEMGEKVELIRNAFDYV